MWVNPEAAIATAKQLALIAAAGPILSLLLGAVSWLLYEQQYKEKPSGLAFLMLRILGVYSFSVVWR